MPTRLSWHHLLPCTVCLTPASLYDGRQLTALLTCLPCSHSKSIFMPSSHPSGYETLCSALNSAPQDCAVARPMSVCPVRLSSLTSCLLDCPCLPLCVFCCVKAPPAPPKWTSACLPFCKRYITPATTCLVWCGLTCCSGWLGRFVTYTWQMSAQIGGAQKW